MSENEFKISCRRAVPLASQEYSGGEKCSPVRISPSKLHLDGRDGKATKDFPAELDQGNAALSRIILAFFW
jgi:hypothetical protein